MKLDRIQIKWDAGSIVARNAGKGTLRYLLNEAKKISKNYRVAVVGFIEGKRVVAKEYSNGLLEEDLGVI